MHGRAAGRSASFARPPRRSLAAAARLALPLAALALLAAACAGGGGPAATATPEAAPAPPIAEAEARSLLEDLLITGADPPRTRAAVARIVEARDYRFIGPMIEIVRASQLGIVQGVESLRVVSSALVALSGEDFGPHPFGWIEWYGGTDLTPPPGFTGWKGRLLAHIDDGFAEFLAPGAPSRIRVEEVVFGGVRPDGIPSLDDPAKLEAADAAYLDPDEPVFGVAVGGEATAYPLRLMDWHEMANDVVGGVPVSLAYCTLCGAGIAYDGRGPDGEVYTFGTSGLLYRSNKLMYDRRTRSLWNQFTGEPVIGPLAAGTADGGPPPRLELLPLVTTSWADWREQHPHTRVLDVRTGHNRLYEIFGQPYGDYFRSEEVRFPVWRRSGELGVKDRVYGLRDGGERKAWTVAALAERRVLNDEFAGEPIVLVATRGLADVEGIARRIPYPNYDYGGEVRSYARGGREFAPGPDPGTLLDDAGGRWRVTEEALIGPAGERAGRIAGHIAFWLGWHAFYPDSELWSGP